MSSVLSLLCILCTFVNSNEPPERVAEPRIVNGVPTTASQYPFIASILLYYGEGSYSYSFCGGSILRKSYPGLILTAAHCMLDVTDDVAVDLYQTDIDDYFSTTNNYTTHHAVGYIIHPNYDEDSLANDLAIIILEDDLTKYEKYEEVQIVESVTSSTECCNDNAALQVIGYGYDYADTDTSDSSYPSVTDTLEYADMVYYDRDECNLQLTTWTLETYYFDYYQNDWDGTTVTEYVGEAAICAYAANQDSCQGDSGGPLMKTGTNIQVGVVSWGFSCNVGIPGVYTNLGLYYDWIQNVKYAYNDTIDADPTQEPTPSPGYMSASCSHHVGKVALFVMLALFYVQ